MAHLRIPFLRSRSCQDQNEFQDAGFRAGTPSASVNLEDIIEDYDGASRKSFANMSTQSNLNFKQISQSYFSLSRDDETSFYSALNDGLTDPDQTYKSQDFFDAYDAFDQDSLWARDSQERDMNTPQPNFQVSWHDVDYSIKPKISFTNLWNVLENHFESSIRPILDLFTSDSRSRSYIVNRIESNQQSNVGKPIRILNNVSGSFKSGELTAIMGPSGAGKTSLLNFLSRRKEEGFSGRLCIENANKPLKVIAIPQKDQLPEYLSVRENMLFASRLKNPYPNFDHDRTVEKISSLLGLSDCLETRTKKISGGQLRRLAIAQEILSKPDILILDEPTSGLDSLTCFKTLTGLKDLVKSASRKLIDPIAIVLTIHQPQHEDFDLFDKVYIMATGGLVIYDGPPGNCVDFVEKYAGIKMQTGDYNPASFLIEIASGEYGQEPIRLLADQVKKEHEAERTSDICIQQNQPFDSHMNSKNSLPQKNGVSSIKQKPTLFIDQRIAKGSSISRGKFWYKTGVLAGRCWKSIYRDPKQLISRIILHLTLPITLAYLMGGAPGGANACPKYRSQYKLSDLVKDNSLTSSDIQDELLLTMENVSLLFILTYSLCAANIAATTLAFTVDFQHSLKEYYNGWYTMPSFILSRLITNIPTDFFLPTIAVALGYTLTNQYTGDTVDGLPLIYRIMFTALAVTLGSMIGQIFGMIFGAIYVGQLTTALFLSQGACLPFILLSGFVVRAKNMPIVVKWFSTISYFRHLLELTFIMRWGYNVCDCDPNQISGEEIKITGVSDELKSFVSYWVNSYSDDNSDLGSTLGSNATSSTPKDEETDLFQLIAKQVSSFNNYGIEVKSCKDIIPYQLYEFQLSERDTIPSFLTLIAMWNFMLAVLLLVVRFITRFRTSL